MFVATDAVASSGSYEIRTESRMNGLVVPVASDAGDGVDGVRRAVRRRVAEGADVIKFYADYRRKIMRFPPGRSHRTGSKHPVPLQPSPTRRFPCSHRRR